MNLHRGQGMELHWRDTLQPPSEADYLQMIANKTGGLFRMILRLLQCVSKCEYDLEPLVDVIGLMFQILDDYKNLKDEKVCSESLISSPAYFILLMIQTVSITSEFFLQ